MSEQMSSFKVTPRQLRGFLIDVMEAGLVSNVEGSPGTGKSSIINSIGDQYALEILDTRLSTKDPVDLSGLANFVTNQHGNQKASYVPFDNFPIHSDPIPDGKQGWLVFFDEFNSGNKAIQAAAYQIILDRQVGLHKLHPNVVMMCAGNLATDRAIVNKLSTAMQSRLVHFELQVNHKEFMEDVAFKFDWDGRIISFLNYKEKYLMNFRPDHNEKTFPCPRTWEFMNKLTKGKDITDEKAALYAGTIGDGVAAEFVTYTKYFSQLVNIRDVMNDPTGLSIAHEAPVKWATVTYLQEKTDDKTFSQVNKYIQRFPAEFKTLYFRGLMNMESKKTLRTHPEFGSAIVSIAKDLYDH